MIREPAVTYEGALRILGRKDHKWLARLNSLLGGTILAAGAVSLGAPVVAGVALKEVFGWLEQKDEALKLVRRMLDALPDRLRGTAGLERRELIIAAHSTIVVAAYFEVLRESLGQQDYTALELTEDEKRSLARKATQFLYLSEIPAPSASDGFFENLMRIDGWMVAADQGVTQFVEGLTIGTTTRIGTVDINKAVQRYESFFLRLATDVPEFRTWVELNEHAATRKKLAENDTLVATFQRQADALARVEDLLRSTSPVSAPTAARDVRAIVAMANRAALDAPIVPDSATEHYGQRLVFPTVRELFINPRHRFCVTERDSRIGDENWWSQREVTADLDLRLVAHLSSATAAQHPLLVLGHPGAGKSMLTRVLAARLPESSFTVVRVPLRSVSAHAPIHDQIQQALHQTAHGRVEWTELVEQSLNQVRVVILDGLDELLHMAQTSLYGYLRGVQEFQRAELVQGRPVVTIVTSRTVVTDRVDIPHGTPVIKLEEFDDEQIERWLDTWNQSNAAGVRAGTTRAMPLKVALEQRHLTAQPLLLMMMAIYVADPKIPMIDEQIKPAELYERLLTNFAEREASKSRPGLSPEKMREDVEQQLRHLSIAALGMYNRGRQDITAKELGADLAALERIPGNAADAGHRVLGKFFFVHVAEAQLAAPDSPDRRYEFLHATFGEYLVARLIFEELAEVTRAVFSARRGVREPEDDLLFALLSFEPVSTRRPTLIFAQEIATGLDANDREQMAAVLTTLIGNHRDRHGSDKFADYRPRPVDHIRELSAYTANLVLLRVVVDTRDAVPLYQVLRAMDKTLQPWRSMVTLWQAGLDAESWNGILSCLVNTAGRLELDDVITFGDNKDIQAVARLEGSSEILMIARYGLAFTKNYQFDWKGDDWAEVSDAWLVYALAGRGGEIQYLWPPPPANADPKQVARLREGVAAVLKARAGDVPTMWARSFAQFIMDCEDPDPVALASLVLAHPELLFEIPDLAESSILASPAAELMFLAEFDYTEPPPDLKSFYERLRRRSSLEKVTRPTFAAIRQLMDSYQWPDHSDNTG